MKLSIHTIYIFTFFILSGCNPSKSEKSSSTISDTTKKLNNETNQQNLKIEQKPEDFLPEGYVIFEKVNGDLNKDGIEDCILIIKGTDKKQIIKDDYRGELDHNRRGIIILFKEGNNYKLVVKNYDCFSSENEDGGVYYAPELSIKINNGNLFVHYSHGRYGYWQYNFRYQDSDFDLIGYDSSNGGAVIDNETSINFLSKKKQEKVNTNTNAQGGDEVFKETWKNINLSKLIKLSEIKNFDELNMNIY